MRVRLRGLPVEQNGKGEERALTENNVKGIKERLLERIKEMNDEKMLNKLNESLFGSSVNLNHVGSNADLKSVKSLKELSSPVP